METKILGGILIFTAIVLFGGIFLLSNQSSSKTTQTSETVVQIDYSKGQKIGSDSAKVKLVEFSDFQCPACAAAEPLVEKIRNTYPKDQVQIIYRHFPLPQHTHGKEAASVAESAGQQGKFWPMHDKLFETQSQWSELGNNEATAFFLNLSRQLGLDENKIKQAAQDSAIQAKIEADAAEGQRVGVNSTPTFFVNGKKLNLQSFDDLNNAVSEELKK